MHVLARAALRSLALALFFALLPPPACANATVLLEDPFGAYGTVTQVGHSAVYLDRVCATNPTTLRLCLPGEQGVVLSRYHRINHTDWLAIPLVAYLYAVPSLDQVPDTIDRVQEAALRDAYRRTYLQSIAPDTLSGRPPHGEWIETVGASYDRRIQAFQIVTTVEQDQALIDLLNTGPNTSHYNLALRNCADFSARIVNFYYPHAAGPNLFADFAMDTPRQVASSVLRLGRDHPEAHLQSFLIPQLPGPLRRSHPARGVAEGLIKTKRYLLPIAIFEPYLAAGLTISWLVRGRVPHHPEPIILTPANLALYTIAPTPAVPALTLAKAQ